MARKCEALVERARCLMRMGAAASVAALCFSRASLSAEEGRQTMAIQVNSSAFVHNGNIPEKFTCDGEDVSPPLAWSEVPAKTASIALINDDPDAPMGTWVHWVLYDVPPKPAFLPENVPPVEHLKSGGTHGMNDFRRLGYGGPCPPGGTHHYHFKVYALDRKLRLKAGAAKKELLKAMEGHVLDQGELVGKYTRR